MSEGLNKVMLLGNLGADGELRMTTGGTALLKLRLVTNENIKGRDGQYKETSEWHSVTVWGKRAEALAKILNKGARIMVEGKLQTRSYESADGSKRYSTEVVADKVLLAGSTGGGARQSRTEDEPSDYQSFGGAPPDDSDVPF